MEAIILAGGLGTRLRAAVADRPKVMAEINGQPFLNYLFNYLSWNNVSRVILATGYLHEKIEDCYGSAYKKIKIEYTKEESPLGTGGAIKFALKRMALENVLILNGDTFFDINLNGLAALHEKSNADLTMALKAMRHISRYGSVKIQGTRVVNFEEKKQVEEGYINAGFYIARKNLFGRFDLPDRFSFEEDFLKKHVASLEVHAYTSDAYFIDIGVPEDYQRAQTELQEYE
jgi:D-glycero-alpha-D-manno-heptose 1-phosphate guanylyltransferase